MRVLLLGGTTEAGRLAQALADAGIDAVYSFAGRTENPVAPPLPCRTGGFGGIAGLIQFLETGAITHVVDASHPFAAQISRHAMAACAALSLPLVTIERLPWTPGPGDRWTHVADVAAAVAALPCTPAHVFLAIGRQQAAAFAAAPRHRYLLRLVDAGLVAGLPDAVTMIARGPFTMDGDVALMRANATQLVVARNAGGDGVRAKLDAARALDLPVILIDRPAYPGGRVIAESVAGVMDWLCGHPENLGV